MASLVAPHEICWLTGSDAAMYTLAGGCAKRTSRGGRSRRRRPALRAPVRGLQFSPHHDYPTSAVLKERGSRGKSREPRGSEHRPAGHPVPRPAAQPHRRCAQATQLTMDPQREAAIKAAAEALARACYAFLGAGACAQVMRGAIEASHAGGSPAAAAAAAAAGRRHEPDSHPTPGPASTPCLTLLAPWCCRAWPAAARAAAARAAALWPAGGARPADEPGAGHARQAGGRQALLLAASPSCHCSLLRAGAMQAAGPLGEH